jgi:hypothetical protein
VPQLAEKDYIQPEVKLRRNISAKSIPKDQPYDPPTAETHLPSDACIAAAVEQKFQKVGWDCQLK